MSPTRFPSAFLAVAVAGALLFSSGCALVNYRGHQKTDRSSSVVNFLYPGQANPLPPTTIPVLRLPLRIGIAFVPGNDRGNYSAGGMSEVQKNALMKRVADQFKGREFIQSIELIPTTYLRPQGGFANLEQVRSMLGVDVICLLAYDQVQFTNENILSLAYWTIVGAYVFHGNKNDTHTLMEAAVYDIASRHLLFRAPGGSQVTGGSTAVGLSNKLRVDSSTSFDQATEDLIRNLTEQLEQFRERAKSAPETVRIEHRPGYTGSGSTEGWFAALVALLGFARWMISRRR